MQLLDYEIDVEQVEPGKWKAHIRRIDGRAITTAPYGPDASPVLTTMAFYTREDALAEAKVMIQNGHMK